jgi:hypothetical protein
MIPVYLIYDNKGNRYGASRSIKKAEEIKTKIENEMREKNKLTDVKIKIIFTQ